jgi:hypothetical protein
MPHDTRRDDREEDQAMSRYRTTAGRRGRLAVILWLSFAVLAAFTIRGTPVRADVGDTPASSEMRVNQPLLLRAEPDPAAPIVTQLATGTVVVSLGKKVGADQMLWVLVGFPNRTPLGWVHHSDFATASWNDMPNGMPSSISTGP